MKVIMLNECISFEIRVVMVWYKLFGLAIKFGFGFGIYVHLYLLVSFHDFSEYFFVFVGWREELK